MTFHAAQIKYMTFLYCLINMLLLRMSMLVITCHLSLWIYVRPWVHSKLCGNYTLPQNFHIRKLGQISLFYAVIADYHFLCWFSVWFGYKLIRPFHFFGLLLYPLKTLENLWFNRSVASNELFENNFVLIYHVGRKINLSKFKKYFKSSLIYLCEILKKQKTLNPGLQTLNLLYCV